MSLVEKKQLEGCRMEFKIKVDGEEFAKGLDKSYQVNAPRLNVPGFRKGKAPKNLVIKTYGVGVLFDEAIKETYPAAYEEVISAESFEPVEYPDIEIDDIDETGYTFKATVTGKPPVKLGKYKGLTAVKESPAVEESEIDNEIENLRERNSRMVDVAPRPVEDGDIAIIDYCGKVGGEAFQGGTAEKQQLEIGSGQFIPGFEEQVKGHTPNPEEPFDITVTFPEGYPAEELSGKEAVFTITLHAIKKNEKPLVDDEFIKDISDEFETVEAFRAEVRRGLALCALCGRLFLFRGTRDEVDRLVYGDVGTQCCLVDHLADFIFLHAVLRGELVELGLKFLVGNRDVLELDNLLERQRHLDVLLGRGGKVLSEVLHLHLGELEVHLKGQAVFRELAFEVLDLVVNLA
ncbi:MAG TPA: trigger factor, partial [Terriglobales bacterium]|nr:trigger factor [Terriglobales bacterium]